MVEDNGSSRISVKMLFQVGPGVIDLQVMCRCNSGTHRQTMIQLQSQSRNPEGIVIQINTWDWTAFLLLYDVGQYYNKENSVLFSQVIQFADNIKLTLRRDVAF